MAGRNMTADRTKRISKENIDRIYVECDMRQPDFIMINPHCHPYYELYYIEDGACRFFIENNMYTRYIYGASKKYSLFFRDGDVDVRVKQLLPEKQSFFSTPHIFKTPEIYKGQIGALLQHMFNEEKIADKSSEPMLYYLFQQLFLLCIRECEFLQELPTDIHTTDSPIVQAAQFISSRYSEQITTADVAAAVGYSPNYLTRKFREAVGVGVHDYLVFIRLQKAAHELVSTKDTITEIAFRCGFSDSNYFKDVFKKKYGLTPRAYRK